MPCGVQSAPNIVTLSRENTLCTTVTLVVHCVQMNSDRHVHPSGAITFTYSCCSAGLDAALLFVLAQVEELAILGQCS